MITAARPYEITSCHWYYPDGKPCFEVPNKSNGGLRKATLADAKKLGLLPSPTTILSCLRKPALEAWKIEQAVLATLTAPMRAGEAIDAFVERILNTDREQDQERDVAAEKGRKIHHALQMLLSNHVNLTEWQEYTIPVITVLSGIGRAVATEKRIITDDYVGTTDLLLENDTEVWVVDFKCTKTVPAKPYLEQRLQLAAYAGGIGNTGDKRIRCANVYISTTTPGEVKIYDLGDWSDDLKAFKLLVEFWKLTNGVNRITVNQAVERMTI